MRKAPRVQADSAEGNMEANSHLCSGMSEEDERNFLTCSHQGPPCGSQWYGVDVQCGVGPSETGHSGAERWEEQPEGCTQCGERAWTGSQVFDFPAFTLLEMYFFPLTFILLQTGISVISARLETRWGLISPSLRLRLGMTILQYCFPSL